MTALVLAAALLLAPPPEPAPAALSLPTIDSELVAADAWLAGEVAAGRIDPADAPYIRLFTTYAIPERAVAVGGGEDPPRSLRDLAPLVLSFVLNSTASPQADSRTIVPKQVSPTLLAIDVRDYGWDLDRWAAVTALDPYNHPTLTAPGDYAPYGYDQGNRLVRADWFITHAVDPAKQLDAGLAAEQVIHYLLIYGRGGLPRTADDFRDAWGVDKPRVDKFKADFGALVEKGKSGVSLGVRRVIGLRTVLGDYWETRDDANEDFLENLFSPKFEAGELITNNTRGLQVYLLFNAAGTRVDIADPKLVVDRSDRADVRVRTGISCISCHPLGINPASNELAAMLAEGVKLRARYQDLARRIEAFYLAGTFDSTVEAANVRYARAVKACNGLDPTANAIALRAVYDWYNEPVDRDQAAREVGLAPAAYLAKITATASGRLAALVQYAKPVPRLFWERAAAAVGGHGAYAESVLHIKGRTADPIVLPRAEHAAEPPVKAKTPAQGKMKARAEPAPEKTDEAAAAAAQEQEVVADVATVMHSNGLQIPVPAGTRMPHLGNHQDGWLGVLHAGRTGWIMPAHGHLEPRKD